MDTDIGGFNFITSQENINKFTLKLKLGGKKQFFFQVLYCEVVLIKRWLPAGVTENENETDFLFLDTK
jgi:hypothetical protein